MKSISFLTKPAFAAHASTSATSRSPQLLLCALKLRSKAALLSVVGLPSTKKGPYINSWPPLPKTLPEPANRPCVASQGLICVIFTHTTATQDSGATGHWSVGEEASSNSGD